MDRKKLVFQSSVIVFAAQIVTSIISFITRNAFIYGVGIDYLGLNGVIADILAMLSLTELGFQFAIVYRLYRPIAENDRNMVVQILCLLKKIYEIIGVVIVIAGACVIPFLKYIINDISVPWTIVVSSYLLYVLATAVTYFTAYRRTLLYAEQRQYVLSSIDAVCNIIFGIFKIFLLIIMKSYLMFVLFYLFEKLTANILIVRYVRKRYSWFDTKNVTLDKQLTKSVFNDTKNIFAGKIAGYVYASTDNLVISTLISTRVIGYIGNYKTVFSTIHTLLTVSLTPFRSMVGNYVAENDKGKAYRLFIDYDFLRYVIALTILGPTLSLIHIFISLWLGEGFLLDGYIIYLLFLDIYISIVHGPSAEYVEVLGYFQQTKWIYIMGAAANIIFSIMGAKKIGVEGVFFATVISQFIMWIGRSWIVFFRYFKSMHDYFRYWKTHMIYVINFIVVHKISMQMIDLIKVKSALFCFICGGCISIIVALIDIIVFWGKTEKFEYLINSLLEIFRQKSKWMGI